MPECAEDHCTSIGNDCCAPDSEQATCAPGFWPKYTGGGCYDFRNGAYVCCRRSSPARERVLAAFRENGLLIKVLNGPAHGALLSSRSLGDVPLAAADCGPWCAAYSLIHPDLPLSVFDGGFRYILMHDAAEMWQHVKCSAVVDSNSEDRSCCSRNRGGCDWPGHNECNGDDVAGYCSKEHDPEVRVAVGYALWGPVDRALETHINLRSTLNDCIA